MKTKNKNFMRAAHAVLFVMVLAAGFLGASSAFATADPYAGCHLVIQKLADKTTANVGDTIEYSINFKNTGTANCTGTGVHVLDYLDPRLTFVSETHAAGVTAGYWGPLLDTSDNSLNWEAGTLTPGETSWIKWKGTVKDMTVCTDTIPNTAYVTSKEYDSYHTWVASNVVNVAVQKDCTPPPPGQCHLVIEKSADKTTAAPGDTIEYTINFKNTGTANCTGTGVHVLDYVDPNLTYVSETHAAGITAGYWGPVFDSSDNSVNWNASTVSPGEEGWVKWKATVKQISACTVTVPNTAYITSKEYDNFHTWVSSNVVNVVVSKNCSNPPPTCTLTTDKDTIAPNEPVTVTWSSTNATTGAWVPGGDNAGTSGHATFTNITATYTFTIHFTGPNGSVDCSHTVTVPPPPGPSCTLSINKTSINPGESVKVSWTSSNVTSGSISPQVGTVSNVSSGTSDEVFPPSDTTYTGTFTGPLGSVTCTVQVTIHRGGGGCPVGGCGGGLNPPNIVLFQKPGDQPLASIFLSQVPYTGFEAGPMLTLIFWLAVALFSAVIAFYVVGRGSFSFVFDQVAGFAGIPTERDIRESVVPIRDQSVMSEEVDASYATSTMAMPVASVVAPVVPQAIGQTGIPELAHVIESRAHAAGVLMSPEAVELAMKLSSDRAEALRRFGDILNEAVKTIPREDGWVMLTSDRFTALTAKKGIILNEVAAPAASLSSVRTYSFGETVSESSAAQFAAAVLSGNREAAFAIIRSLEHDSIAPTSLMTGVASVLDRLYRVRQGGENGIDQSLVASASHVSDENLHAIVEIFTHALDTVYANPFTGVKLALAQAFELVA